MFEGTNPQEKIASTHLAGGFASSAGRRALHCRRFAPFCQTTHGRASMRFHADLHVHSKYSRATSRDLDLEHLAHWAGRKGVGVVATGDFTHPAWRAELKDKLISAEPGLFRLKPEIEQAALATLPPACRSPARFMLAVEISTIYKKAGRTRKIHHLIYAPDFATADRISASLARIGNIASDGRPILGLDSRDLLEITLAASPDAYLVPAHIWTPWFAALGSQSGFDSIEDCYGDLARHIFAVETGLSSDPPMNWRLSMLDRFRLVSNSDAHSPGKLGREATTFDCDLDYFAIRRALETGDGYVGTVEFFPEEGKYHLDGHRKCAVRLAPRETLASGGRCPHCGEPATVGVLHRVEVLADRSEAEAKPPATAGRVASLVPLPEIIAEIVQSGHASKTVERAYDRVITALGPELSILGETPLEDIARADSSLLAEAITRLRAGQVIRESGYDGEYGVIRLFADDELKRLTLGGLLFDAPLARRKKAEAAPPTAAAASPEPLDASAPREHAVGESLLAELDPNQRRAAGTIAGPLLIIAGPGSGKTRTLTHRIAHLIAERGVAAENCLAITFTRRAAEEMRERLAHLLGRAADDMAIHTFHSLGLAILRDHPGAAGLSPDFRIADEGERAKLLAAELGIGAGKAQTVLRRISRDKRRGTVSDAEAFTAYQRALAQHGLVDFDDLVSRTVAMLEETPALASALRARLRYISVDEFQDVDAQQYRLLRLIAPAQGNLCVIGDPDQAIYGFRGADAAAFDHFRRDYPSAAVVRLARNYRSSGTIVSAATQVIASGTPNRDTAETMRDAGASIEIRVARNAPAEAEQVARTIEEMIGGHSFFALDSGRAKGTRARLGFADFAVLTRTGGQAAAVAAALDAAGIPVKHSSHEPLAQDPVVRALIAGVGSGEGPLPERLRQAGERLKAQGETDRVAIEGALTRLLALAETCREPQGFLDAAAVASEADFFDPRADRVSLLTLHAAKGLEFPVVFIAGLEDGLLPLRFGGVDDAALAEERRLLYVGMTRARDRLILSRALERPWRGRIRRLEPSPFLDDIAAELVCLERMPRARGRPEDRQLRLL
jgi:DNA helicase-2/ATP-dependent DNA helicase PcrA